METYIKRNLEPEGNCKKKGEFLKCKLHFDLHTYLGSIICKQIREAWINAVRREPFEKWGSWQPAASDRVSSIHFVDELATDENHIPSLFLGYEGKEKKLRITVFRKLLDKKMTKVLITPLTSNFQEEEVILQADFVDNSLDINIKELHEPKKVIYEPVKIIPGYYTYWLSNNSIPSCVCQDKSNIAKAIVAKINRLTLKNKQLKHISIRGCSSDIAFSYFSTEVKSGAIYITGWWVQFQNKIEET